MSPDPPNFQGFLIFVTGSPVLFTYLTGANQQHTTRPVSDPFKLNVLDGVYWMNQDHILCVCVDVCARARVSVYILIFCRDAMVL